MPTLPRAGETMGYHVEVTEHDILHGVAGNCFRCAVSLALQRATGDDEANVYEMDWLTWLHVHGRDILAPGEVRQWIWAYDGLDRDDKGRIDVTNRRAKLPEPITFDLPELDDPEWQERCYHCEALFPRDELDDEGVCAECRKEDEE